MTELLLHLLVLSPFVESLAVGPVTIGRLLAAVALFAALMHVVGRPDRRAFPAPWVGLSVVGLSVWVFVGLSWAPLARGWLNDLTMLALAVCYFLAYITLLESRAQVDRLLLTFAVAATLSAVVGLAQAQTGVRAIGLQGDANTYALYELCAVPVAARLAATYQGLRRAGWLGACLLLIASVMASQSRGGLIATIVVVLLVLWRGDAGGAFARRPHLTTAVAASVCAALVALAVTTIPRFSLQEVQSTGGTGRVDIWRAAWRAWEQHPLLGIGPGNFEGLSGQLLSQTSGVRLNPNSVLFEGIRVHNSYLEPWVEMGPVGLLLYLAVLLSTAVVLLRCSREVGSQLFAACVPMLIGFATATFFISAMNNKVLWMLVGFAGALPYLSTSRKRPASRASQLEAS